eukprot:m.196271 g.196271  ORF g.196271 m.196271 type:complete len:514 (+) comp19730_c0_seq1:148-1689(+)
MAVSRHAVQLAARLQQWHTPACSLRSAAAVGGPHWTPTLSPHVHVQPTVTPPTQRYLGSLALAPSSPRTVSRPLTHWHTSARTHPRTHTTPLPSAWVAPYCTSCNENEKPETTSATTTARRLGHRPPRQSPFFMIGDPGLIVTRNWRDPGRDTHYEEENWVLHRSPWRKVRHVALLPFSSTLRRLLFPDLAFSFSVATAVVMANTSIYATDPLHCPALPFTLTSTALALLLAFRTNYSNKRFEEGRTAWVEVVTASRTLLRLSSVHAEKAQGAHLALAGLLRAFSRCLVFRVCANGDLVFDDVDETLVDGETVEIPNDPDAKRRTEEELVRSELRCELSDVISDKDIVDVIMAAKDPPSAVLRLITDLIASNLDVYNGMKGEAYEAVHKLEHAYGMCEKIVHTPIPTSFSRHTSRYLAVWMSVLPLALWSDCGMYTIPVSVVVSFVMLGIEDIGVIIEEPFDILPLWSYVDEIDLSAEESISPPPSPVQPASLEAGVDVSSERAEPGPKEAAK